MTKICSFYPYTTLLFSLNIYSLEAYISSYQHRSIHPIGKQNALYNPANGSGRENDTSHFPLSSLAWQKCTSAKYKKWDHFWKLIT